MPPPENREPTAEEIEELRRLIEQASNIGASATAFAGQRLNLCVRAGRQLMEWKDRVPRGQWEKFLDAHYPDFCPRTGQRWILLAKSEKAGALDLETARGVRHAYLLAGIIPESEASSSSQSSGEASWIVHLTRLASSLQKIAFDRLSDRDRKALGDKLEPIARLYQRLAGHPSAKESL